MNKKRPCSSSTSSSKTSGTTASSYASFSTSRGSQYSSLEDILVQKYIDQIGKSSVCSERLQRKYSSPYTKKVSRDRWPKKKHGLVSATIAAGFRAQSHTASTSRSSRSLLDRSSPRQEAPIPVTVSDCALNALKCTNNPPSALRTKRPRSAPSGHYGHLTRRADTKEKVYVRQPNIIKVMAFKNGTKQVFAKITVPNIDTLLEESTTKLNLNSAARRVFLPCGKEAFQARDIPHDSNVYISTGESFVDPIKTIKDHLSLTKEVSWTVRGVVLPVDKERGKTKPVLSKRMKNLTEKATARILVFKNGTGQECYEIVTPLEGKEQFLDVCTQRLDLMTRGKCLYNWMGNRVTDLKTVPLLDKCLQNSITPLRGPVWVSKGEGFLPSGAKVYLQGVVWALHQKLKPARDYSKQVDYAFYGHPERVTYKDVKSMTTKELYKRKEAVENLIDELRTAIAKYRGQLFKLVPQLQTEEKQRTSFVYQHIKQLAANNTLTQGLQLKVYQNGKGTGEILFYTDVKHITRGCGNDLELMMKNLLQLIHQRLMCFPHFKYSSLNRIPSRLFDEDGREIKNPLGLENEQKVWASYKDDFRSISKPYLTMTFDRAIGIRESDKTRVYRTQLDNLQPGLGNCEDWEVCTEFPESCYEAEINLGQLETLDPDSHFLHRTKEPQLVVCPSLTVQYRTTTSINKEREGRRTEAASSPSPWPSAHTWVITKAGLILNRAVPRLCLAVSDREVRLHSKGGQLWEAYGLILQKRKTDNIHNQLWCFTKSGHIYCKAYPGFPLTYLKELGLKEELTPKDHPNGALSNSLRIKRFKQKPIQSSLRKGGHAQERRVSKAPSAPEGTPEDSSRLTVALIKKLEEKHPQAAAQRWAIKQEGITKPGQWKHSVVVNPLWNKLTYMWPVLPDGNLNEEFKWPIEGSLLPNVPSLRTPAGKGREADSRPTRLRVLRNGQQDKSKAATVSGPDIVNALKKTRIQSAGKPHCRPSGEQRRKETREDGVNEARAIEFQQCLERCTSVLGLPFAARRMFDESGKEIVLLQNLQRDQLVYVSCGERWRDPKMTLAEQKKRLHLNSLASDIALIRSYCSMRHPEGLVLEAVGGLVAGAKLALAECAVAVDQEEIPLEGEKPDLPDRAMRDEQPDDGGRDAFHSRLDPHARAHLKLQPKNPGYPWERNPKRVDEDDTVPEEGVANFTNAELYNKYRPQPRALKHQQIHRQRFEFGDGYLANCSCPWLVVGVGGQEGEPGTEVVLAERKADDVHQRWILREEDRTFHLLASPGLVLAVSMAQIRADDIVEGAVGSQRGSIVLQKYKAYSYGVANQKWCWIPELKVLNAFYTTTLDQEVTAANQASLCTFSISNTEEMDQPGYYFTESGGKRWITLCLACAKALRGTIAMTKLPAGTSFICATGCKESSLEETGPFKCLSVAKTDLSTSEAGNSLSCWEEKLVSLRKETSVQRLTQEISAARTQRALKLLAFRNGADYRHRDGQLIVGTTFASLLAACTWRLELTRPASRLYTAEGTQLISTSELIAWAVNESLRESGREGKPGENTALSLNGEIEAESARLQTPESSQMDKISGVMPEDLECLDPTLLTILLRNPIEVWVSCGEPHLPMSELHRRQRLQRKRWLEKEKVLCDLDKMKHRMRHLQGRRVGAMEPATMVPTKSPIQPVVVEGGWTEPSPAEVKLMEEVQNMEMHLSEVQAMQVKEQPHVVIWPVSSQRPLYSQPNVKRVMAYLNGGSADQGVYAWGGNVPELLDDCTERLQARRAAQLLFTPNGEQINSWEKIERDMLVCVSAGEPFLTSAASRQRIDVRASYARVRKERGTDATT